MVWSVWFAAEGLGCPVTYVAKAVKTPRVYVGTNEYMNMCTYIYIHIMHIQHSLSLGPKYLLSHYMNPSEKGSVLGIKGLHLSAGCNVPRELRPCASIRVAYRGRWESWIMKWKMKLKQRGYYRDKYQYCE